MGCIDTNKIKEKGWGKGSTKEGEGDEEAEG